MPSKTVTMDFLISLLAQLSLDPQRQSCVTWRVRNSYACLRKLHEGRVGILEECSNDCLLDKKMDGWMDGWEDGWLVGHDHIVMR